MQDNVNRILFISLSNIGDAVMTTPVLQALHKCYPGAVVDIVGDQRSSEIFKYCPYLGMIFHKQKKTFLRGVPGLLSALWHQHYDLVIDIRTDGLAYLIPASKRFTKRYRKSAAAHAVQQHLSIISDIYHGSPPPCNVWIGDEEKNFAREVLGDLYGKRLLGLGPGANAKIKIWPKENYMKLVENVSSLFDAVVLLGDSRDREISEFISSGVKTPCIDLCGLTNILQVVAAQQSMQLFIGNDSGLGHLACAAGIPTITIFGIGEPDRYRPWGPDSVWLQGQDNKLENIKVDDVVHQLKALIRKN